MNVRLYRVSQDGQRTLAEEAAMIPTTLGEVTWSRDQVTEFMSYPLSFVKGSSINKGLGGLAGSAISGLTSKIGSGISF